MYENACEHIRNGGVVVYPTDTLWGMGVNPFDEGAMLNLFRLKKMRDRVVSVAFPDFGKAQAYVELPWELSCVFPAPLTVIAKAYSRWKYMTLNGKMGIRIPDNRTALGLLRECGPLTATSANIHGGPNLSLEEIKKTFGNDVLIVEGEEPKYMEASTVIDIVDRRIIRPGAYPSDKLRNLLADRERGGTLAGIFPPGDPLNEL